MQPWFWERDAGRCVQCKYGSRTLTISGKRNAVFVTKLDEVGAVLDTQAKAAQAGELEKAIDAVTKAKAAKAAAQSSLRPALPVQLAQSCTKHAVLRAVRVGVGLGDR